jgi:hypothetical protein
VYKWKKGLDRGQLKPTSLGLFRSVLELIEDNHMKLPHVELLEIILLHYILVNLGLTFRHACRVFKSIKCATTMAKYEQMNIELSGKRI